MYNKGRNTEERYVKHYFKERIFFPHSGIRIV